MAGALMGVATSLASLARTLIAQEGQTATMERTGTGPAVTFTCTKVEKPSAHSSRTFTEDAKRPLDMESVRFLVAVPSPLPSPYTRPIDWATATFPRHSKFTVSNIQFTIMRIIEIAPEDITVVFTLLCNT